MPKRSLESLKEKARPVRAPLWGLLRLDGEPYFARMTDAEPGMVVSDGTYDYVVVGKVPGKAIVDFDRVIHISEVKGVDENVLVEMLNRSKWEPKRSELLTLEDGELGIISFVVDGEPKDLEYSLVYVAYGGPDEEPWQIDVLVRKDGETGKPLFSFKSGEWYTAYGVFRWSNQRGGRLRFNVITAVECREVGGE